MNDTAKLIAIVVIASFATERVLAATTYVLDAIRLSRGKPRRIRRLWQRQWRKLFLLTIAAGIAAAVVWRADVRVLKLLKLDPPVLVDVLLSWLIVLGGADKLRSLFGAAGAPAAPPPQVKLTVTPDGAITPLRKAS